MWVKTPDYTLFSTKNDLKIQVEGKVVMSYNGDNGFKIQTCKTDEDAKKHFNYLAEKLKAVKY